VVNGQDVETYRTVVPAVALNRRGIKADVVPFQTMTEIPHISQWNVFVMHHMWGEAEKVVFLIELLQSAGCTVVCDWDDNPHLHFAADRGMDPNVWADRVDMNTVATPALKLWEKSTVLPNCLDLELWERRPKEKPLTVGLTGGASHYEDWKQVVEPLKKLQEEFGIRIVVGGYYPGYMGELDPEWIPWKTYSAYPDTIREMDILLCPVDVNDDFNLYKSGIKAVEGMAIGAVPVCSDHPIYRRVVTKNTGVLVADGWYEPIKMLLEDHTLRSKLSSNGWKWVRKNRDINTRIREWMSVYGRQRTKMR
jgi:glycosyltransferase involved in cell wall biosynthesis